MPDPIKITIQNKVYTTPILNGEMDDIANQIQSKKSEIADLNHQLRHKISELNDLEKQIISMYIQQTGGFP